MSSSKKIIHVDMDCFYAAVEAKHQPELAGLALGIGGSPQSRGVLCTASYEARKFGVKSAMSSAQAIKLCPHLIILPPNFALYKKESAAVREIFSRFSNTIEPLSLDEAFLDVSEATHFQGSATLIAQEIRKLIYTELQLTASAGVAPNKFLAKIASDWNKPNGLFVINPGDVASFIKNLSIEKIHGVGKVTAKRMHELGLHTCADIQRQSEQQLTEWFGSRGAHLLHLAHGEDNREVETEWERKSLTVEETFEKDIPSLEGCLAELPSLYSEWKTRFEKSSCQGRIRGIVVKLKFFDFQSTTHESTWKTYPTTKDFKELLERAWNRRQLPVRLIGLGVKLAASDEASDTSAQLPIPYIFSST